MALRQLVPEGRRRVTVDNALFIVNIVLLLILFFLATGRMMNSPNFGVDLSETETLPIDTLPKPLLILADDGGLTLDGVPIQPEALAAALADQVRVHVLINKTAPAMTLVKLLGRPELARLEVLLVTVHMSETGGT